MNASEKTKDYRVSIAWSKEDGCYYAKAPALPGCIAHGETMEECAKKMQSVMTLCIEIMIEFGDPFPELDTEKHL